MSSEMKVEPEHHANDNHTSIRDEISNIKTLLSKMYVPNHFDSMMRKVGRMERDVAKAQQHMANCYNAVFFNFFVFTLFVVGVVYIMWRMDYFKFLFRQNVWKRFKAPKRCYACYRPWKRRLRSRYQHSFVKSSMSAPEFQLRDYKIDAPRPQHSIPDMNSDTSHSSDY